MPPMMASSIRSKDEIDFCLVAGFDDAKSNTGVVFVANRLVVLVVAVAVLLVYWDDGVLRKEVWEFGNVNAFVWGTADSSRNGAMNFMLNIRYFNFGFNFGFEFVGTVSWCY